MSWTIESALRTTFALVRDNFGPFFAATLAFTAPLLLVDLVGADNFTWSNVACATRTPMATERGIT